MSLPTCFFIRAVRSLDYMDKFQTLSHVIPSPVVDKRPFKASLNDTFIRLFMVAAEAAQAEKRLMTKSDVDCIRKEVKHIDMTPLEMLYELSADCRLFHNGIDQDMCKDRSYLRPNHGSPPTNVTPIHHD